uniref:Uncharacterized protein n=1 Tax=Anguilla anguilla TaxID=7936 RepID=A0A0E9UUI3_ANGAN
MLPVQRRAIKWRVAYLFAFNGSWSFCFSAFRCAFSVGVHTAALIKCVTFILK